MPLKLRPPRPGKTPYYSIRGTHLGIYIEQSTGTGRRELAEQLLRRKRDDIERGAVARPGEPTFAEAAVNYMEAGGERRFLAPIIMHFKVTALSAIDQAAIDRGAAAVLPHADAPTRNRQFYTPVSAVLKRAGIGRQIKRPIGWRGRKLTHWLTQQQAFAIFKATSKIGAPAHTRRAFRAFLILLCYTGMRLSDALNIQRASVNLRARTILLPRTKTGEPRLVYLPAIVVKELRHHGVTGAGRLFGFHAGGRLRDLFKMALDIAGVALPRRVAFHVFCHTWATWMRQHGGLDTYDLLKTDRWSDAESADRYSHVVVSELAKRADRLPVPNSKRRRA